MNTFNSTFCPAASFKLPLWFISVVAAILITGCSSLLTPDVKTDLVDLKKGQYRIDPSHTTLIFKVNHLGLSTFVGRFNDINATLDFSPDDVGSTRLNASVKMASVDTNDEKLDKMLRGNSWFKTGQFPETLFETTSAQILSDGTYQFTGNLTFLGVTAPLVLDGRFNGAANNLLTGRYTLGFSATGTIRRSEFGMEKFIPMVGDDVSLEVYAEFLRE